MPRRTVTIKNNNKKSMAKRKTGTRPKKDDAAWVEKVLKKLIIDAGFTSQAELEARVELFDSELPELNFEMPDFSVDLTGLVESAPQPVASPAPLKPPLPPASGTRTITIRVHERVVLAFKAHAEKTGTPYQTLMKRALSDATESFV